MKYLFLLIILSSCSPKEQSVDDFPETIYPETPTMRSASEAMETK